eukprot:TRINITY_DN22990_c0_g1_i1.p1 TRINITY_DN22990_c0_g1~~TRINITY_DN22990_c0_g1_i1.p1  ORF type:complete len:391 (-),score=59.79 TRINITY_DN22990_c0_g1_i1:28-1200(-)
MFPPFYPGLHALYQPSPPLPYDPFYGTYPAHHGMPPVEAPHWMYPTPFASAAPAFCGPPMFGPPMFPAGFGAPYPMSQFPSHRPSAAWFADRAPPQATVPAPTRTSSPPRRPRVQIVIPMAGAGQRFRDAGITTPKPLLPVTVGGVSIPMVSMVAGNVRPSPASGIDADVVFVVQRAHFEQFRLNRITDAVPGARIAFVEELTEGPACTVLAAMPLLDPSLPLLIANSDQFLEWDADAFYRRVLGLPGPTADAAGRAGVAEPADGAIVTFHHPEQERKWSYAAHDAAGRVTAVKEKDPISTSASVGIYYFRSAEMFVSDAHSMIDKNVRVNNEFYVIPVYEEALARGDHVIVFEGRKMWGTGTPDDYDHFMVSYRGPWPPLGTEDVATQE